MRESTLRFMVCNAWNSKNTTTTLCTTSRRFLQISLWICRNQQSALIIHKTVDFVRYNCRKCERFTNLIKSRMLNTTWHCGNKVAWRLARVRLEEVSAVDWYDSLSHARCFHPWWVWVSSQLFSCLGWAFMISSFSFRLVTTFISLSDIFFGWLVWFP